MGLRKPVSATVEGQAEVNAALNEAANFDVKKAGTRAAEYIIPFVSKLTRRQTGLLATSFVAADSAIGNPQQYAVVQEFGSDVINPTHAIYSAWDQNNAEVVRAFFEEVESAADKTGLGA